MEDDSTTPFRYWTVFLKSAMVRLAYDSTVVRMYRVLPSWPEFLKCQARHCIANTLSRVNSVNQNAGGHHTY